jgi:inorganic pyrophosphatase
LEPFETKGKCLNVVVETPKGSRIKYAYDMKSGFFTLSKPLPEGMIFPFNFGFAPKTLAADGDPVVIGTGGPRKAIAIVRRGAKLWQKKQK